jgi:hypothetical protein
MVATTFQPSCAKRFAVARPMPEEAPVIRIVLGMVVIVGGCDGLGTGAAAPGYKRHDLLVFD